MFQGERPWQIEITHPEHGALAAAQDPRPYKAAAHAAFDLGEWRKVSRTAPANSDESGEARDWQESPYFRRVASPDNFSQPPTKKARP